MLIIIPVILTIIIFLTIIFFKININNSLKEAIKRKDVEKVYRILTDKKWKIKLLDKENVVEGLNLLFYRAEFDKYLSAIDYLNFPDEKVYFLRESDIVGLDIEPEIVFEKRPREIGLVALKSSDWKVLGRLNLVQPETLEFSYGIKSQEFLEKLFERGRFKAIIGHNIYGFDIKLLESWGVKIHKTKLIDTYVFSILVLPEAPSHSLEYLSDIFKVEYTPHKADEDAYASLMIFPKLISIAKRKKIFEEIVKVEFEPICGLKEINIFTVEVDLPFLGRKCSEVKCVEVTIDASECLDSWYPVKINIKAIDRIKDDSIPYKMAKVILKSFIASGGTDPEKLKSIFIPYDDIKEALSDILEKVVEENKISDINEGLVVEYRHLRDFLEKIGEKRIGSKLIFRGAFLLKAYYQEYKEILKKASKLFEKVILDTLFELQVEDSNIIHKKPTTNRVFLISNNGLDKSSRHAGLLSRLLASVVSNDSGRSIVIVSNESEKLIAKLVSSQTKKRVLIEFYGGYTSPSALERIYRMARAGYYVVVYSTNTILHKYGLDKTAIFVKSLAEILRLSGRTGIIINTDGDLLSRLRLEELTESIEIDPRNDLDLRISYVVYDTIREAVEDLDALVRKVWGFALRPYQRKCVARLLAPYTREGHFLDKPFTIVLLPTGSGKSVIFQSVALLLRKKIGGTTVVISPLLALIEDQINSLKRRGVKVCSISSVAGRSIHKNIQGFANGEYDIVYITPEQFQKEKVRKSFEKADINYLVIDEIHTMYKWGKTFRPSYDYLAQYLRRRRDEGYWIPIAGFTATLPQKGLEEVTKMLTGDVGFNLEEINFNTDFISSRLEDLEYKKVLKGPIIRDNIVIDVEKTAEDPRRLDKLLRVVKYLSSWADKVSGGSPWLGLIYTGFVRSSKDHENAPVIADFLSKNLGEEVLYFHGQMSNAEKKRVLEKLYAVSRGDAVSPRIIVATKAFGMGVDLPNIRWVVHYMMPENIEDYYQEIGRGGRDGKECKAVMLYAYKYDYERRLNLLKNEFLDPMLVMDVYDWLVNAEDGAIIPIPFLIVPLTKKFKLIDLYESLYKDERLPETAENTLKKSLNMLSKLGILDYDLTYDSFILVDRHIKPSDVPGYPIMTVHSANTATTYYLLARSLLEKNLPESGYLYIDRRNGLIFVPKQGYDGVLLTGEDVYMPAIRINSIERMIPREKVYSTIAEDQFYNIFSLFLMDKFSREVLNAPKNERNYVAKEKISSYLSGSIEELYQYILNQKYFDLRNRYRGFLEIYNALVKQTRYLLIVPYIDKDRICEMLSAILMLYLFDQKVPPTNIAVILPYGYKSKVSRMLINELKVFDLPIVEPKILNIKRDEIRSNLLNLDLLKAVNEAKGINTLIILSTNPELYTLAEYIRKSKIAQRVYEIRVIKQRHR